MLLSIYDSDSRKYDRREKDHCHPRRCWMRFRIWQNARPGVKSIFLAGHVFSGITKHFDSRLAWQSKSRGSKAAPDVKEINEARKRVRHSKADGGVGGRKREKERDWDLAALSKRFFILPWNVRIASWQMYVHSLNVRKHRHSPIWRHKRCVRRREWWRNRERENGCANTRSVSRSVNKFLHKWCIASALWAIAFSKLALPSIRCAEICFPYMGTIA